MMSGVFGWSEDSRAVASDAGLAFSEVLLEGVTTKAELIRRVSAALACPPGFGGNWDALADSLQDLSWKSGRGLVIALRGVPGYAASCPGDWRTLRAILDESAEYWACSGKGSFVVLLDIDGLPHWA